MADIVTDDGRSFTLIDADTISDGKQRYRIDGYNAPEESKVFEDDEKGLVFKRGQVGGSESTKAVQRIIKAGGFNKIEDLDRTDSFGRKRIRIKNELGDDLTNTLYESGAIDVTLFTDKDGLEAVDRGRLQKELKGKRAYEEIVNEELGDIKSRPITFKDMATNEREYAESVMKVVADQQGLNLGDPDDLRKAIEITQTGIYDTRSVPFEGIEFRKSDRTIENVATNQFGAAWNQGWKGMTTGLAGFAELLGVGVESETLKEWGADNVDIAKRDLLQAPELKNIDYRDVDGVWDAFQFMTNNVAMSAPYLITLIGGTALAPFTGGASAYAAYGSVGASYAGQVWNDIKGPKGKAEAAGSILAGTGMAVLDRLGLAGIMKPSLLLTKQGRLEVAEAIKAGTPGMTLNQAKAELAKKTKAEIKDVIKGMGNFSSAHINNSSVLKNILKQSGRGTVAEGVTEAAQEGLGYLSSSSMSEGGLKKNFNPNEFQNLLLQSAIAGGTLGFGFGGAGAAIDYGDRFALKKGLERGNRGKLSEEERVSQEIIDAEGQGTLDDVINELQASTINDKPTSGSSKIAGAAKTGEVNEGGFWQKAKNPIQSFPRLYRASSRIAYTADLLRRSKNVRKLAGLVGMVTGKIYSGVDVQGKEAQIRADLIETINPKRIFRRFGLRDSVSNSQKISDMIRRYMNGDTSNMTDNDIRAIQTTIEELNTFTDKEYFYKNSTFKSQGKDRKDLNQVSDYWFKHQNWDWQKIRQYRDEWYTWMRANTNIQSQKELDQLYNKLSNNEDATDFSVVEGIEYLPGTFKGSTDQVSSKAGFEKFANTNILQNMINLANQTAKYTAYTQYFGAGGKYIDKLLRDMAKPISEGGDGLSTDEVAHVAFHTKNIIDAGTGNYNSISNKKLAAFQRVATFYATLIGLPLSAISSFPEFAMMMYQAKDMAEARKGILSGIKQAKEVFKNIAKMKMNPALANVPFSQIDTDAQKRLTEGGLFNDDAAVATRFGLGETDVSKAWWQKQFFKYTGIAGITQFQRAMAASLVSNFVGDRIKILAAKPNNVDYNQTQLEIYRQLVGLGINVDTFIRIYKKYNDPVIFNTLFDRNADQSDLNEIDEQMRNATWSFVNDRVQNPQAFNRPLFFQDPHFQMFVQFNGFISTFTANIIPKIWNDYLKNGSPRMKYNTFALMVTMLALGGASQWLKDFIKFKGSTPYLSDAQLFQRALMSAGLLGSGERLLQGALPLYKSRDESVLDRFFGETVGASPTVRTVGTAMKGISALGSGDTNRFVGHTTKLIPGVGPITPVRNIINDLVHGRDPDPYPFAKEN